MMGNYHVRFGKGIRIVNIYPSSLINTFYNIRLLSSSARFYIVKYKFKTDCKSSLSLLLFL